MSKEALSRPAIAGRIVASPVQHYRELVADRLRAAPAMRLGEYVEAYSTSHEIEPETVRQYRITAAKFEAWAGGAVMLHELSEMLVSAWLRQYAGEVSPATVRSKRTQLMALWRAAADELLCDPPLRRVRTARVPWVPRECWTLDEVRQLVVACGSLPRWHPCGLRRSEWWALAVRIAWDTGLRWGDMVTLRVNSLRGNVFVVGQRKTRRPVCGRLSPTTLEALTASLERCPRELVVPWTASHETFRAQARRLIAKADVRRGSWKWLRRGSATDVEIQEPGRGMAARHLGHAPGSRIAEINYLNPTIIAAAVPMVSPREIGAVG